MNITGEQQAGSVLIELEDTDITPKVCSEYQTGLITAHHMFFPEEDIRILPNGDVVSWGIDNAAGVAVATSCITQAVLTGLQANVSVVYTASEEARFLGILSLVGHIEDVVGRDEAVLWIVVDCSDAAKGKILGLDAWKRHRFSGDLESFSNASVAYPITARHFEGKSAVVRLEDTLSVYELSATRLLYQAALGVRRLFHQHNRSAAEHSLRTWELGKAGVFVGGLCDASILLHLDDLLEELGGAPRPQDRVGSIVIPLMNYRHIGSTRILPETTYTSALDSAYHIVMEAVCLHRFYSYPEASASGYRGLEGASQLLENPPSDREALVAMWSDRITSSLELEEQRRKWCNVEGVALMNEILGQ